MEMNKVYQGDCAKLLEEVPENLIDLTVTSPPYDNLRRYEGYNFDFEKIATELYRVTKLGGVVVWVVGDATIDGSETGSSFKQCIYFKQLGFKLYDTMIYAKDGISFPDANRYQQCFEYMFVLSKGFPKTRNLITDRKNKWAGTKVHGTDRNKDGTTKRASCWGQPIKEFGVRWNIWHIVADKNFTGGWHPAPFPEKLAEDHILTWSNQGDLVLDPMAGSGTTLKMAKKNNRNFLGFEISEKYIPLINKRLEQNNIAHFSNTLLSQSPIGESLIRLKRESADSLNSIPSESNSRGKPEGFQPEPLRVV